LLLLIHGWRSTTSLISSVTALSDFLFKRCHIFLLTAEIPQLLPAFHRTYASCPHVNFNRLPPVVSHFFFAPSACYLLLFCHTILIVSFFLAVVVFPLSHFLFPFLSKPFRPSRFFLAPIFFFVNLLSEGIGCSRG